MRGLKERRVIIYAGLITGCLADGYLRLISGDEGNLLVHSAVFLGSAVLAMLIVKVFFHIRDRS